MTVAVVVLAVLALAGWALFLLQRSTSKKESKLVSSYAKQVKDEQSKHDKTKQALRGEQEARRKASDRAQQVKSASEELEANWRHVPAEVRLQAKRAADEERRLAAEEARRQRELTEARAQEERRARAQAAEDQAREARKAREEAARKRRTSSSRPYDDGGAALGGFVATSFLHTDTSSYSDTSSSSSDCGGGGGGE